MIRTRTATLFATGLVAAACALAAPVYRVTTITPPEGLGGPTPTGFNAAGQITGFIFGFVPSPEATAFVYSEGQFHNLGTLGGSGSEGRSINAHGHVVGASRRPADDYYNAFVHDGRTMRSITPLVGLESTATGINDNGQVVGYEFTLNDPSAPYMAFFHHNGTTRLLGAGQAHAINAAGQVTGMRSTAPAGEPWDWNALEAFLYSDGQMTGLGSLGGSFSEGLALNVHGHVVGHASLDPADAQRRHAFLYRDGQMIDLGTLYGGDSSAFGINANGDVVGRSSGITEWMVPFLYTDGQMHNLNSLLEPGTDPSIRLFDPVAIDDQGRILLGGEYGGQASVLVLTPVPEPQTYALMAAGLGVLAWARSGRLRGKSQRS